jgi:hypothetical protein
LLDFVLPTPANLTEFPKKELRKSQNRVMLLLRGVAAMPEDLVVLREKVLSEARITLNMNLSLLEMLKGNTPVEDIAKFRDEWAEPYERLVSELKGVELLKK